MIGLPITALYGGMLALIGIALAMIVGSVRAKADVSIGDGGNVALIQAIRRHGNWAEYVPMAVILLGLLEVNGANTVFLHGSGVLLVIFRILHPMGIVLNEDGTDFRALAPFEKRRLIGSFGTDLLSIAMAIYCILLFF